MFSFMLLLSMLFNGDIEQHPGFNPQQKFFELTKGYSSQYVHASADLLPFNFNNKPGTLCDEDLIKFINERKSYGGSNRIIGTLSDNNHNVSVSIKSSGFLTENNVPYREQNLLDLRKETIWCENANNAGIGAWIKIDVQFQRPAYVPILIVYPGNGASHNLFYQNNRLKTLYVIVLSEGLVRFSEQEVQLSGDKNLQNNPERYSKIANDYKLILEDRPVYHMYSISYANKPVTKYTFYIYIGEVYSGSVYNDTCIGDVDILYSMVVQ